MSSIGIQPSIQPNTNSADKRDTEKSVASSRKTDSTQSQSNASANLDTGQSEQLIAAFRLLMPLLTKLIQQFSSSENPPQQENPDAPIAEPMPTEPGNPTLPGQPGIDNTVGTPGDDKLIGTYGEDRISGLAGNDRLFGRQGNDVLSGNSGNDDLYGGRGDDTLYGGTGNDYLSGGTGNNQLFGGEGDDILASRLGSDKLDGGQGNDTARIRGSIDNYSVQVNLRHRSDDIPEGYQPTDLDKSPRDTQSIILTHNETGQTIEVSNIEQFRFDDTRLSLTEMIERAVPVDTPPPPPTEPDPLLDLSASQKDNLFTLFGEIPDSGAGIRVEDKDGNGKLSVGDTAILAKGDASSVSQQFRILSAEDVAFIEGNNTPPDTGVVSGGGVSVGGSSNGETIPDSRIVEIKGENYSVGFLKDQVQNYAESSYPPKGIVDTGFGEFQWGTSNSFAAGGAFENYIADTFPKGESADQLDLGVAQHKAISAHFNHTPPPNLSDDITTEFTGVAIDQDGDGKLGVGDTVQLHVTGGLLGLDETNDHVLTADDIKAIETDRSNPLLDISNGLSFEQRERLNTAIFGDQISLGNPSVSGVHDNNSDGKLSAGDTLTIFRDHGPIALSDEAVSGAQGISIEFHTLTQDELDRYLAGSDTNTQAQTDFETNKQKWESSQPENYSFTLERTGFLAEDARKPVDLTINGDTITDAKFADGSAGSVPEFNQLTVDQLFNRIEQAIDTHAAEVRVEYNDKTGIPESIFIDQDEFIADEEVFLKVSNFEGLDENSNNPGTKPVEPTFTTVNAGSRFSLEAPTGSVHEQKQGFDSIVGLIKSPEYTLSYDLGPFGGLPNPRTEGIENYQAQAVTVDGKPATLATYFDSRAGVEQPYKAAIQIQLGESFLGTKSLILSTSLDSPDQFAEIEKVFKSVKFEVQDRISPPDTVETNPSLDISNGLSNE